MDYVKPSGNESCRLLVLILAQIGPRFDSKGELQLQFKNFSTNGVFFLNEQLSSSAPSEYITSKKVSLSGTVVTFFNRSSLCGKTMFPYALTKIIFFTFTC